MTTSIDEMATPSDFQILSEKTLHHTADPALVTYCPTMDLVALVTTDQQVLIYRLNGQRVYGAAQKAGKLQVASIRWKPNGWYLCVEPFSGAGKLTKLQDNSLPLPGVMDQSGW